MMRNVTNRMICGILPLLLAGAFTGCSAVTQDDDTKLDVTNAPARDYYVSPKGDDENDGTREAPLATIQNAIDLVNPGGTVILLEGIYKQTVYIEKSGSSAGGYITLQSAKGQTAVLDGDEIEAQDEGVIHIDNASYIRVQGIHIQNVWTNDPDVTPAGIFVNGAGTNVELRDNTIHHIGTNAKDGNAHGIAIYGDETQPYEHVSIIHNELFNLTLGTSEALAVNGNVEGFRIEENSIHDCDNIGIDIIGFEGTSPNEDLDRARNGTISQNHIYNISTENNPAYDDDYSAAGIYVDGGKNITIVQNEIHDNDYGIELASEHRHKNTSEIKVSQNKIYHNRSSGLSLGGYDAKQGGAENCTIDYNEFTENNTDDFGYGEIHFAFYTKNNTVTHNKFTVNDTGLFLTSEKAQNTGNMLDFNEYAGQDEMNWTWKGIRYDNLRDYQNETGHDKHSNAFMRK